MPANLFLPPRCQRLRSAGPQAAPRTVAKKPNAFDLRAGTGDPDSGAPVETLSLRRGLSRRRAIIFRAERAAALLPAFKAGAHDWSMATLPAVIAGRRRSSKSYAGCCSVPQPLMG